MDTDNIPTLSREEIMILSCVSNGMSTKEVAEQLHFSQETVRRKLAISQGKLNAKSYTHAVANAIRKKIIK